MLKNGIHISKIEGKNTLNVQVMKAYFPMDNSLIYFLKIKCFNFWQHGISNIPKNSPVILQQDPGHFKTHKDLQVPKKQAKFLSAKIYIK